MKKLNKKIYTGICSALGVALIALCLFCSLQNKHDYKAPDSESPASTSSSIVAANAFEQPNPSLTKTDAVVTNTNNDSNSADGNDNKVTKPKTETHNDNVVKYEELWAEGYELPANVCSSEDPGVIVYYKYEKKTDNTYKLLISNSDLGEGTKSFDSTDPAPWVNSSSPKQEAISEVIIVNDIAPTNTIGWFGCQTDNRQYAHLSQIKKIIGLDNLDMSNVKNASFMFCGSNQIESVEASDTFFNTITQVDNAFGICNYTRLLNDFINKLANKICKTATNASWAFANNKDNLTSFEIDDEGSQVSNACYMFYQDKCLETITANKLIYSKDANVERMFYDCGALKTISLNDLTNWSSVTNSDEMFKYCWRLVGGKGTSYADKKSADKTYAKIDGGDSSEGYFTVSTSTKKPLIVDGKQYFPVAGKSLSPNITFYKADGTKLPKTGEDGKYQQSDLTGATYYSGTGSFKTLRSIQDSWNNTFYIENEGSATTYPCDATGVKETFIKNNLVGRTEDTEQVYRLNGNPYGGRTTPANYEGVSLTDIWNAYNPGHSPGGFGGAYGSFWSSCASSSGGAYFWASNRSGWHDDGRFNTDGDCVLVCRAF
ncbi:MAG: hypothetical protein Q4E88_06820 [Coriobacteriia bacterium]|nr:hypothetical protein [Coriobacteriia bacterium]